MDQDPGNETDVRIRMLGKGKESKEKQERGGRNPCHTNQEVFFRMDVRGVSATGGKEGAQGQYVGGGVGISVPF